MVPSEPPRLINKIIKYLYNRSVIYKISKNGLVVVPSGNLTLREYYLLSLQ